MEDAAIVELYLARDERAVAHTAEKYGASLRGIANRILCSMPAAEECENDTYFEAWNRIPPSEPRTYLFAFLGRIVRHLAIDRCRAAGAQKRSALICELTQELELCIPASDDVHGELEAAELSPEVWSAFLDAADAGLFVNTRKPDEAFYADHPNSSVYDTPNQAHLILTMSDGTTVRLRLLEGGYVAYDPLGWYFVQIPGEAFNAVYEACGGSHQTDW